MGLPIPAGERSRAVDILRAVAVLGTVYQHSYYHYTSPQELSWSVGSWKLYPFIFGQGWLGVNLFFMLSGFVLYRPNLASDRASIWRYYGQRAWRLWPLFFLLNFLFLLAKSGDAVTSAGSALLYCTGINNLIPGLWIPLLAVFWSLGVEILFSALLPGLLRLQQRFGFGRVCGAIVAGCFFYRIAADYYWFTHHPEWGNRTVNPLKDNLLGRLDDFIVGMVAAHYCVRGPHVIRGKLLAVAVAVLVVTLYCWNIVLVTPRTGGMSVLVSGLHLSFAGASAIILCALYRSRLAQHALLTPLVVLGQICFSVYILHSFIYRLSEKPVDFADPLSALGFFAVTLFFSFFCFIVIEARGIHRKPAWLVSMERRFGLGQD